MSRKKEDKRVLISPRENRSPPQRVKRRKTRKKRKTSGITLLLVIIALVAFVIGAGIGVSLSFDTDTEDDGPQYENVTKEMTSNLNDTEEVYFDSSEDDLDFNSNQTLEELNITEEKQPSY